MNENSGEDKKKKTLRADIVKGLKATQRNSEAIIYL